MCVVTFFSMGSGHSSPVVSPTQSGTVTRNSQTRGNASASGVSRAPHVANSNRPELSRTGVIKNSINVKRNSIVLEEIGVNKVTAGSPVTASSSGNALEAGNGGNTFEISFSFDSSTFPTKFKIWFQVTEFLDDKRLPIFSSPIDFIESPEFPAGLNQSWKFKFDKSWILVPLSGGSDAEAASQSNPLYCNPSSNHFAIVIETCPPPEPADSYARQLTYLTVDPEMKKVSVIKQKLRYGDKGYELHEIFGIERSTGHNSSADKSPVSSVRSSAFGGNVSLHETDDVNGTDCVICLSEPRDTTVLPCRHLCLCARCAEVLRINSRRCPICRQPVSSMLQIDRDVAVPASPKHSTE